METTPIQSIISKDLYHLGVVLGPLNERRIIALPTGDVFDDLSLLNKYWGITASQFDSGFQAHLYTRPGDTFIVRVPNNSLETPPVMMTAIQTNWEIWHKLTGLKLATARCPIVLTAGQDFPNHKLLPDNLRWYQGRLLDIAIKLWEAGEGSILAFTLNKYFLESLQDKYSLDKTILTRAADTSFWMDKNLAMAAFEESGVRCPKTFTFDKDLANREIINSLPPTGHYVFKPAGGAAGIGVFGHDMPSGGATIADIQDHMDTLRENNIMPARFQVQEFIPGEIYGSTGYIFPGGTFKILEIHKQKINRDGRFTGGKWNSIIHAEFLESTGLLFNQLSKIKSPSLSGLIGLDIIDGKIIEINPRITASAPIAHMLFYENQLRQWIDKDFRINSIDLNTSIHVPYEAIKSGFLIKTIELYRKKFNTLILPQGLNPFGASRFIFINDDDSGNAQNEFTKTMTKG